MNTKWNQALLAAAWREVWRQGYQWRDLRSDLLAGLSVAFIAIPLAMALAIACGVAPQYGLYTAVIAAPIIAILGGSRFSVAGPTAAFVVVLFPVVQKYGIAGLYTSTLMAGILLVMLALARCGRWVAFIPYSVTAGFTAGIGVVIASLQIKDFFGLMLGNLPSDFSLRLFTCIYALPTWRIGDTAFGLLTLFIMWLWPKFRSAIPSHLVAVGVAS